MVLDGNGSDLNAMPSATFEKVISAVGNIELGLFSVPVEFDGPV